MWPPARRDDASIQNCVSSSRPSSTTETTAPQRAMEKTTAAGRQTRRKEESQLPPSWEETQESLAAESGLALLLVEGHQPPQLLTSNNNSICHALQSSAAHAHLCDPYCGVAFERARGETDFYRCHAGFHCFAAPFKLRSGRQLAVIGGRAFLSTADYRALVERFRTGDLRDLFSTELFGNVLFTTQEELERLSARVVEEAATAAARTPGTETVANESRSDASGNKPASEKGRLDELFTPDLRLREACQRVLKKLTEEHSVTSLALLLRDERGFINLAGTGRFKTQSPRVRTVGGAVAGRTGAGRGMPRSGAETGHTLTVDDASSTVFTLPVGGEIKGVLVIGDAMLDAKTREALEDFCRRIATPLELLRLREELERRMRVAYHLQSFTEQVNSLSPDEAYAAILRHSTELLRSERGSLLLFNEEANELQVKAAVGPRAAAAESARIPLGEGVSGAVLREGRPLLVHNLAAAGRQRAPAERKYKTESFISYPLVAGGRKVGVLNMTDKAGGGAYDDLDLNLLELLAPQMALALDRAEWHQKATQFQLLSITDALTGLLNRRYLEERLGEELERSKRHRFPMSFLMIDIDNFKEYNDRHGHQAGDTALELTAQCLKSALRSADVAARYGGEEFSVLLPQTSLAEARVIAERIRARVAATPFPHREQQPGGAVTVSIGISSFGPRLDTPASIIGAADQALYVAKSHGKNRIEAYAPPATNTPA